MTAADAPAAGSSAVKIEAVAAAAGVSIKTVSRVINREPHVSEATRLRVEAAIRTLGYQPNVAARALAGQKSYLVALFGRHLEASYGAFLQAGVRRACRAAGRHLIVEGLEPDEPAAPRLAAFLASMRVDGIVLPPPDCDDDGLIALLQAAGKPFVRVSPARRRNAGGEVFMDDAEAAAAMTRHLLELGHRRIAHLQGSDALSSTAARRDGYVSAMAAAGLAPDVVRAGYHFRAGFGAAERLLARPRPPTAVFAFNDAVALGALAAANRRGVPTPERLSVAGFDDGPLAQAVWPQLTTVRQPVDDMAELATEMLFDGRWSRGEARRLDYELKPRGSTAPPDTP